MKGKTGIIGSHPCRALQTLVCRSFICFTVYLIWSTLTHAQCLGDSCEYFKFIINEDVTYNHALEGHVFVTATAPRAGKCHLLCRDDCRCISMNYLTNKKENNCQLNDDNKYQKPGSLKPMQGSHYYDLVRYITRASQRYLPGKDKCVGRCCQSCLCLNAGKCEDLCEPEGPRFKCLCQPGMGGKYCQLKLRGCKDVWDWGKHVSGSYVIYDQDNNSIPLFCDLESESNFTWTLIQSYSLANNEYLKSKHMRDNHPMNENSMEWEKYRLSLLHMQYIAETSTHFRATCNFPADGLVYTDYARAKLDGLDIFGVWDKTCVTYEFLNIRGTECINCTAATRQKSGQMYHINSHSSLSVGCSFNGCISDGCVVNEQNFGLYNKLNPAFRCSSAPDATTQLWFGQRKA